MIIRRFRVHKLRIGLWYGCENRVFVLNSILELNYNRRTKVCALLIDLSTSFDLVKCVLLWSKLYSIGLSEKFYNIFIILQKPKYGPNLGRLLQYSQWGF
jgi:hypothetical protein